MSLEGFPRALRLIEVDVGGIEANSVGTPQQGRPSSGV